MLIKSCPACESRKFKNTNIIMPEGCLKECLSCGQKVSQCSEDHYVNSMQEFNVEQGTSPQRNSLQRAFRLHSKRLKKIAQFLCCSPSKIKLLDVGCSSGAFLNSAKRMGFKTHGVEPAEKAALTARNEGHKVFTGMLEDARFEDNSFDAITLFEVIEHLTDPLSLLKEMKRILKPNGVILISTGNHDSFTVRAIGNRWDYFSISAHGGHISFFKPKSMQHLIGRAGLIAKEVSTVNVRFCYKNYTSKIIYRFFKILSELLNPIAKITGKGHDMIVLVSNN